MSAVDAHHHLWDPQARAYPWLAGAAFDPIRRRYGLAELRACTAAAGIERTVLVQTLPDPSETQELLGVAAGSGGLIAGVVGWVDLQAPDIADTLARLQRLPGGQWLVGVRHQVQDEPDPHWLSRPTVRRGLRAVAAAGLVYDLLVLPAQLDSALAAVRDLPQGRFVLDHAAKPPIATGALEPWAGRLGALAGLANVACKLSGLVTQARWHDWDATGIRPWAEHVLAAFGPGRVLFGSDWPVCELAASYQAVHRLAGQLLDGLAPHERQLVMGTNATTTYHLT
jgi:L-fuconolactonase